MCRVRGSVREGGVIARASARAAACAGAGAGGAATSAPKARKTVFCAQCARLSHRRGQQGARGGPRQAPPPLLPRTNRTRRVPHPVLIGHAASLTPY
jgi:hypothetical protein